jgi:hypothetical protein
LPDIRGDCLNERSPEKMFAMTIYRSEKQVSVIVEQKQTSSILFSTQHFVYSRKLNELPTSLLTPIALRHLIFSSRVVISLCCLFTHYLFNENGTKPAAYLRIFSMIFVSSEISSFVEFGDK